MSRVFLAAARRSAVVPRHGGFKALEIHDLAAPIIAATLEEAGFPAAQVEELILSNALGGGGNPARAAALAAGLPQTVAGLSLDRQCCGGLDAVLLAEALIRAGRCEAVLAGGAESYSRRPLRLKTFADGRPPEAYDQPPFTPWPERDPEMTAAAEALGRRLGISRAEQDLWAIESHAKARAAPPSGEIAPLAGISADPFARDLTPALCARAKPLAGGAVTSANAAPAADGAAFCLVVSESVARRLGRPVAEILSGATLGADPEEPGTAPVAAIRRTLDLAGAKPQDLAFAEIMEAFAVQALACQRLAGLAPEIVNRGGGALARGHPIGASGAVNVVRLFHDLRRAPPGSLGLAAIAAAGGLGSAIVLRAFSSEADEASRRENATKQEIGASSPVKMIGRRSKAPESL